MTTELPFFGTTPGLRQTTRPVPFIVRHLAGCKPNRLAASIRIPVTPANRVLLRDLRAAELVAWQRALPSNGSSMAE